MTAIRIIHVSDLHLGVAAGKDRHQESDIAWSQFMSRVHADPPDLVVVTGDIVVDDPDFLDDHLYARQCLTELGVDVMVLPGNHDVGDHYVRDGLPVDWHGATVTDERVQRWESLWGPSYTIRDLDGWTIIGLNSQLFGSGLNRETEQWEWLKERALPHAQGRHSAVFMHEALHLRPEYADEVPENGWMSIPRSESERLADLLVHAGIDLIGSGHTHRFAQWTMGGLRALNAPSLVGPIPVRASMVQPLGVTAPGWIELTLDGDHIGIEHANRAEADLTATSTTPGPRDST